MQAQSIEQVQQLLSQQGYVCGRALATVVFLSLKLGRPLFLEGEAGTGKTEIAKALAWAGLEVPEVSTESLPALDWVAESQKGLPPLRAGRFFVHAAHAAERCPASALAIRIEAGQAFGTGHHESTRGCLLSLEALARHTRPRSCPDLGCGSGILAIAMAKRWHVAVLAADIDPLAVAVARGRLKRDAVFRDTALHFLRRFDALMARMARELGEDQMIAEIGDTRTGRAFMLIARVSGAFE